MEAAKIRILCAPSQDNPFLVVDKPSGLPSAPLREGEDSALTQAMALFPEISHVEGRKAVERGLVHRIDTATRGCVLIATTQDSYDHFLRIQAEGGFVKQYRAVVDHVSVQDMSNAGFPPPPVDLQKIGVGVPFTVQSCFRGYGAKSHAVRPVTEQSGRAALKKGGNVVYGTQIVLQDADTVLCRIAAGYRHQVRCHLAWLTIPVRNDPVYNPLCTGRSGEILDFTAISLEFTHPLTGAPVTVSLDSL